ncbi:cupin domain-containing protein [Nocardioides kongjuensis]|uniref:AraC-like DNA-binding protein n=1 Tax=Nocardioides kongjuensis TaxID=349522 RepID=A0A852RER7_9ACTN|nr:AraC family transcriptional regulator [Nocardioides kongjuensis]NYD29735.1 AraC-like DNA-binding protein [Nocardioides kongjuensis]
MPDPLPYIADPLAAGDALSDVLEMIHLRGGEVEAVHADGRRAVRHRPGSRVLHLVETGEAELRVDDGGPRVGLRAGDLALLARGRAHALHPGPDATWLSGSFAVEERVAAPLLAVLPTVIVIRGDEEGLDWLPLSARLLGVEVAEPRAGSQVMVSRILDLLFIQALRTWAARGEVAGAGWLTAALDPQVGRALKVMHRRPEDPWTVDRLADLAAMSRAAFAARFGRLAGESPGRYLQRLRLARAADRLTTTREPAGSIGRSVGYSSEAAFSRAFAREYGTAPRAWRAAREADGRVEP